LEANPAQLQSVMFKAKGIPWVKTKP